MMNVEPMPITGDMKVRYFTKTLLSSIERGRSLSSELIESLGEGILFPISEHSDAGGFVKATVVVDAYGNEENIYLTPTEWDSLPSKLITAPLQ